MGGAVGDGDVFRFALQYGFESIHGVATHVSQSDVKVDGFTKIELPVFILVVDDLVVEDDVRSIGWNDTHDGFIAQVVLTCHDEVDFGRGHLGNEMDGLRVASSFSDGEDIPTAFHIFLHEANYAAFRGGDADFAQAGKYHFRMNYFHLLRHLRVDAKESVAVGGEHGVSNVFVLGVVGPGTLSQEILTCHIAESRHPVARVFGEWTIGRHEIAVKEVIDTPNICVVDERVGDMGRAEQTYGAGILTIVSTAHPFLCEAVAV